MNDLIFTFKSYAFDDAQKKITLRYEMDAQEFVETLELPTHPTVDYSEEELGAALFNLHIIGGVSYYKAKCPRTIQVDSGELDKEAAQFWNEVYTHGLGEFFYENKIDFRGLVQFPVGTDELSFTPRDEKGTGKILLPFGGGKDSVVSAELLAGGGHPYTPFVLGQHDFLIKTLEERGHHPLQVKRHLDPQLFELNKQGAYNGHIPISAYIACLTIVLGILYGYEYVVLSNEHSASQGNVEYLGEEINHQYSKSLAFESAFIKHIQRTTTKKVHYFSLLRSWSELRIAEEFAKYPQYFGEVTSCNRNFKIHEAHPAQRWCGECPKCAFVFLLFAVYIPKEKLIEMFGQNVLNAPALKDLFMGLLGKTDAKPFECVGTYEEVNEAFWRLSQREEWAHDVIVKAVQPALSQKEYCEEIQPNQIPSRFKNLVTFT